MRMSRRRRGSATEAVEDIDKLFQPPVALVITLLEPFGHALFNVAPKDGEADPVEGRFGGCQLLEDFNAQTRFLDHPANAPNLAFYAVQTRDQRLLLRGVQHTP